MQEDRTIIKGCEKMLTPAEVAELIGKPVKFVRERLIKSGALKAKKISSCDYRIRPQDFKKWQEPK